MGKWNNLKKNIVKEVILYALSAVLLILTMPAFFDLPLVGFIALVPAIIGIRIYSNKKSSYLLFIFYGLIYSIFAYSWFKDIFSGIWGYLLIIAVALWHSNLMRRGVMLEIKVPDKFNVFIFPIFYATFEFLQRNIPFIKDWWFIPYAKTSWGFPEGLWILSVTGITGVTFLMILSNSTVAKIIENKIQNKKQSKLLLLNIIIIIAYLSYGFYYINIEKEIDVKKYSIGVVSDMANEITGGSIEGGYVDNDELSENIINQNLELSNLVAKQSDFIVWSENEFFDVDDTKVLNRLREFSKDNNINLVIDGYLNGKKNKGELYDVAVLLGKNQKLVNIVKKKYLFHSEIDNGFKPSNDIAKAIPIDNTKVGMGVCYDFHFVDVVRDLAKDGARIILMPRDDDMNRNKYFPLYHSTDGVFRAIENKVAFASANTNGGSIVIDYKGRIKAYSDVNTKSSVIGRVDVLDKSKRTIYNIYGEWFGYLLLVILSASLLVFRRKN